ncbi:MAG: guanylate kinase [Propionibacteriaceae bacterium]|nr:guanylate kinase [Propionibacteriaceae bacterium]
MSGDLTVISGPAAVGKGTLVAALRKRNLEIFVSVSATTRRPRPGEIDAVHYHFVCDADFDQLIADDELLEWALVHETTRYGTPKAPVLEAIANRRHAILEIDLQGARQVREKMPEARTIFIAPPTPQTLLKRMRKRGTESEAEIEIRMQTAAYEISCQDEFDHIVINDDLEQAVLELEALIGLRPPAGCLRPVG